ncbi:MAG: IS110 family transposase [Planctomycetes bacterium]|nr:IS110 family transposase [Planctomycetota bacterium]
MDPIHETCAGLDVHKKNVVACVKVRAGPGTRARSTVRTFGTTTRDLEALAAWLKKEQVTHVAMESTGVYWKPIWNILEEGFSLYLCNAQHVKQLPGRKTDVRDCDWLAGLLQHGLLRGSFVPSQLQRELRDLTRYRAKLSSARATEVNRVHKVLEDANIKLGDVATEIMGVSGRAMLDAIVSGESDPDRLANLAHKRMRGKIPQLRVALHGRIREHHRFMIGAHLELIDTLTARIAEIEQRIDSLVAPAEEPPSTAATAGPEMPLFAPSAGPTEAPTPATPEPIAPAAAPLQLPPLSFKEAIELLDTIPGVSATLAQDIVAEIGTDMSRFPTPGHLASWAGLCPGNNASAGKVKSSKCKKGDGWLKRALGIAASAAPRMDTFLSARYRRLVRRRGSKRALVAVAHAILRIAYFVLSTRQPYTELGADYHARRDPQREIVRLERRLEQLRALKATPPLPAKAG